ncbi:MAG: DUF362 domain-containing protein [Anaerolineales bacterium]|nr:DUF362 domain-containing protein [Anaerolineales bacterium]
MSGNNKSLVIIESTEQGIAQAANNIMEALAPGDFAGAKVLVKPNMVGPSTPDLGHTTHPEVLRAVVRACKERNAEVIVGDNPGGISSNSRNVAEITGILEASEGCYMSISERVIEMKGRKTGLPLVISQIVLDADYVINLPRFKTHTFMMVTGAIKNTYGYLAGACKAKLHLDASHRPDFADAVCDLLELRPPELNIMDATTVLEGNGPCHGGSLRQANKLIASHDALALDSVMARMMGVEPDLLPLQKAAIERGLGKAGKDDIEVRGPFAVIPNFKMPVSFSPELYTEENIEKLRALYPSGMMNDRVATKPVHDSEECTECGDCKENCPPQALDLEPEFNISDECIACFCCVELCPVGALEVPDIEAFRHW